MRVTSRRLRASRRHVVPKSPVVFPSRQPLHHVDQRGQRMGQQPARNCPVRHHQRTVGGQHTHGLGQQNVLHCGRVLVDGQRQRYTGKAAVGKRQALHACLCGGHACCVSLHQHGLGEVHTHGAHPGFAQQRYLFARTTAHVQHVGRRVRLGPIVRRAGHLARYRAAQASQYRGGQCVVYSRYHTVFPRPMDSEVTTHID